MDITTIAGVHARWVEARQGVTAQNIAHADTPNFRRAVGPDFAAMLEGTADAASGPFALAATHPGHVAPEASTPGFAVRREGTVNLQTEMVEMATSRRAHDLNVAVSAAFHRFHMSTAR